MELANLFFSINLQGASNVRGQIRSLSNSFKNVGSTVSNVGRNMANLGRTLTVGVTAPLLGLVAAGIKYNSTNEDINASLTTLLGSEKKALDLTGKLKDIADKSPFSFPELASTTKKLAAYGIEEKSLVKMTRQLGDVSLGNKEAMEGMGLAMAQISGKGKMQTEELYQLQERGWNPLEEIMKKTGETSEEVRERMEEGKVSYDEVAEALENATSKGGRFYKGMDNGSKTLSGKLSILKSKFMELLGNATKPFFDYLKDKALPAIFDLIDNFNKLSPPIKTGIFIFGLLLAAIGPLLVVFGGLVILAGGVITAIGAIAGVISAVGLGIPIVIGAIVAFVLALAGLLLSSEDVRKGIKEKFEDIKKKIKKTVDWIKLHLDDLKNAFKGLVKGISTGDFDKFSKAMKNMVPPEVMEKINEIIEKVKKFRDKVIEIRDKIISFKDKIVEFGDKVNEVFKPIKKLFADSFKELDLSVITKAFDDLKASVAPLLPVFKVIGVVVGAVFAVMYSQVLGAINGIIKSIDNIVAFIINIIGIINSLLGVIIGTIVGLFTGNWDMLSESAKSLWENIKGAFENGINAVVDFVTGFVEAVIEWFQSLYNTLVGGSIVPDMINAIVRWFKSLPGKVMGVIKSFVSKIKSYFNSLKSKVISIFNSLKSKVISIWNGIKSRVSSIINSIKSSVVSKFNSLKSRVSSIFNSIKSRAISIWNGIKSRVSSIANSIKSSIISKFNSLKSRMSSVMSSVKSTFVSAWSGIKSRVVSIVSRMVSTIKSIISGITGTISSISKKLGGLIDKAKSVVIPGHAKGIMNAPFGHVAMVGEQGPELMYVPKGANIYTARQTRDMLRPSKSFMSSQQTGENIILNGDILIDAKNVEEFNNIVKVLKGVKQYKNMR